jgi:hypothetical protein
MLEEFAAAIATTFVAPLGMEVSPFPPYPHATTVPSDRKARLCSCPAEMATTFVALGGGDVAP